MPIQKIIVAMSGGVDSSVTAALLLEQGYAVEGLFMKNWEEDDTPSHCAASQDIQDAQAVCDLLGIPLRLVNFAAEYWDEVFEHFLSEFRSGRTPNPDIGCNKYIKFKACLDYAFENLGADKIATGHYATIRQTNCEPIQYQLAKGHDSNKDQSYFLYTLGQHQLRNSLFPLGAWAKSKVREYAKQRGLPNHHKKDSTGICFIGEKRFKTFLNQYLHTQKGLIKTTEGQTLGEHDGVIFYTIGQRKGLHIGGQRQAEEAPWYVVEKDLTSNTLIVAQHHEHPALYSTSISFSEAHFVAGITPDLPLHCSAKTRYRQLDVPGILIQESTDRYRVNFEQPQWAVAPGQSVVIYNKEIVVGGGIITECHNHHYSSRL